MQVYVQLGSASYGLAKLSTGNISANGVTTWTYPNSTPPPGGPLQITAYAELGYTYPGGSSSVTSTTATVTVVPSTVEVASQVPQDGQVFVGSNAGNAVISAIGSASTSATATITSVSWVLLKSDGTPLTPPQSGAMTGPFGTTTCNWSGLREPHLALRCCGNTSPRMLLPHLRSKPLSRLRRPTYKLLICHYWNRLGLLTMRFAWPGHITGKTNKVWRTRKHLRSAWGSISAALLILTVGTSAITLTDSVLLRKALLIPRSRFN